MTTDTARVGPSWLARTIWVAVRALVLGTALAAVAALVIVTAETAAKLPASLLCGFAVGVFFAPVGAVELLLGRRPPGAVRVLAAFGLAIVLLLGLGLLSDLQISYTTLRLGGQLPEDAFRRLGARISSFFEDPQSRLELLAPSVVTMAAVVAARVGFEETARTRLRKLALETGVATIACVAFLGIGNAVLTSAWHDTARITFSTFGLGTALVAPAALALADRVAVWVTPKPDAAEARP